MNNHTTRVSVYGLDMKELSNIGASSPLIINETPSEANIKSNNLDENTTTTIIPKTLLFGVTVDMISNNFSATVRREIPIRLKSIISDKSFSLQAVGSEILRFFTNAVTDPIGTIDGAVQGSVGWVWSNGIWLLITLMVIVIISVAYRNFKGGGGFTLNINGNTGPIDKG